MAAVSGVRACPDLRPCLTLVPTKPCDETRPQERGFNKRYRFLELRLGDFPEDRLCLAGGLRAAGTRLPLSSSALSTAATLDLSLTTWKSSPLGAGPPGWVAVAASPGTGGRAGPGAPPNASGMLGAGWARPGPLGSRNSPPPSRPLPRAVGDRAGHRFTGSNRDTSAPSMSSARQGGRLAGPRFLLLSCWLGNPGRGETPLWQGQGGPSET